MLTRTLTFRSHCVYWCPGPAFHMTGCAFFLCAASIALTILRVAVQAGGRTQFARMDLPPSTYKSAPVINCASSPTTARATEAVSHPVPIRPRSGTRATRDVCVAFHCIASAIPTTAIGMSMNPAAWRLSVASISLLAGMDASSGSNEAIGASGMAACLSRARTRRKFDLWSVQGRGGTEVTCQVVQ